MARYSQTDLVPSRTEKRVLKSALLGNSFERCLGRRLVGLRTARLLSGLAGGLGSLGNDSAGGNGQLSLRSRGRGDDRGHINVGQRDV